MIVSKKIGEITLNGKQVSVFSPPHAEPDFPWVDVDELARAYFPRQDARRLVSSTRKFGGDHRAYSTARNGDRIVVIICHAMAQGLVGLVDFKNGHTGDDEGGPAHREYGLAFGMFAAKEAPMSMEDIIHAFHNPGGEFLRNAKV